MANRTWKRREGDLLTLTALGVLVEGPQHAYGIQRVMHWRHREFQGDTPRAVYRAVDRLAAGGLVELAETVREGHHPERSVYRATEAGQEELRHWLVELLSVPQDDPRAFTAAVSMLGYLPEGAALGALAQRVAHLQGRIAAIDAVLASLVEQFGMPRLFMLEREYQRELWVAELGWIYRLIEQLRSGQLAVDQTWLARQLGEGGLVGDMERGEPLAVQAPRRRVTGPAGSTTEGGRR